MTLFQFTENLEFFGIIYALILIAGLYQVGSLFFKIKQIKKIFFDVSETKYQNIFLSTNFILLIFYPLILFSNNINFIPIISLTLFIFGIFKIMSKLKIKLKLKKISLKQIHIDKYLVIVCLFGLLFLSMSPNTHGDSLGYHFVVANKLLSTGKYLPEITHYHTFLGGAGEIMIAVGLFFNSEQFGGLVQFSGLISIFGVFKKIKTKKNYYYLLLALTSPIILFLSSTAKPQLFHVCSTAVIFSLYLFGNYKHLNSNEQKWQIFLSLVILTVSVNSKLNFLISTFLIGSFIFYMSLKSKNLKFFLLTSIMLFISFYFPIILWKYLNYGGNFLQHFYSPVPSSIPGFDRFTNYLVRFGRELNFVNFIFPKSFSQFTNVIGISFFYIVLLNFKNTTVKIVFLITIIHMLISYLFGQFIGRSLLEPLFWILLISAKYEHKLNLKLFEYVCRLQAIIVIIAIFYGVFTIFPGSLSKSYKDKVLSKNASGYSLFKWANTMLTEDDIVISAHRAISLGKSKYISSEFSHFQNSKDKDKNIIYDDFINKSPEFFLTWGYSGQEPYFFRFKNCVGKLIYYKSSIGRHEARNPFNRGNKYNGYIYKFKLSKFPACMEKD